MRYPGRPAGLSLILPVLLSCAGQPPSPTLTTPTVAVPEPIPPLLVGRPTDPGTPFTRVTTAPGLLDAGDELAYGVSGPFGPGNDCTLAVVHRGSRRAFHAVLGCNGERWQEGPLGAGSWSGEAVQAVVFRDLDGDGYPDAAIVAEWTTGIGPEGGGPFLETSVLRWTGERLERLSDWEAHLQPIQTMPALQHALEQPLPLRP